jgi:hypothetical protein
MLAQLNHRINVWELGVMGKLMTNNYRLTIIKGHLGGIPNGDALDLRCLMLGPAMHSKQLKRAAAIKDVLLQEGLKENLERFKAPAVLDAHARFWHELFQDTLDKVGLKVQEMVQTLQLEMDSHLHEACTIQEILDNP